MEVHNVDLTISAVSDEQYPKTNIPEIALVGRSNVGKSSLTNVLINRRNFAHTSSQPGKTQTLNFYDVEDKVYFVDVPGYGYAKVSKKERERFGKMIEQYLTQREQLRGVIQLVDARHEPTPDDVNMYNWLQYYNIPTLIVGTKIDKVKRSAWNRQLSLIKKTLDVESSTPIILFSATEKKGKDDVWQWIEERMGNEQVLTNCALGLAGESGQVVDLVKNYTFRSRKLDRKELIHEMGDVLWYLSQIAEWADIPFEEVAKANIEELNQRYPTGFKKQD